MIGVTTHEDNQMMSILRMMIKREYENFEPQIPLQRLLIYDRGVSIGMFEDGTMFSFVRGYCMTQACMR